MKRQANPPRLADVLFERFCKNAQIEDLHGDVQEIFHLNLQKMSIRKAKCIYWFQIISLIFSYAVKRRKQNAQTRPYASASFSFAMLRNYFLTASRSLVKNKLFTLINVFGLAVGMSISLLVITFLSFIWRYDEFHVNKEDIYRIISTTRINSSERDWASAPLFLVPQLTQNYSGIAEIVRIKSSLNSTVIYNELEMELSGYYVDPAFLKVFTFPLVRGNSETVLEKPHSIVLTQSGAKRIFGDTDPMGMTVSLGDQEYEVTGVLLNHPKHSHMQFEALVPYKNIEQLYDDSYVSQQDITSFRNEYVYLQLATGADANRIEKHLNQFAATLSKPDNSISFELQKLADIAPGRPLSNSIGPEWDLPSLSGFVFVALLILLPASFNYANISIARSLKRMKEIGLRKVMGGLQTQIFTQFIIETVLIAFVALGIAFYIFSFVRYEFLSMLVSADAISLELDGRVVVYFVMFTLLVGIATGFIPALYLSRVDTIQAMKKRPAKSTTGFGFRKSLTVFQFALSLAFITSMVIVFSQYRQTINYDFGFDQANILDVQLQGVDPKLIENEFSKLSSVSDVSFSSHILGVQQVNPVFLSYNGGQDSVEVSHMYIDDRYIPNLGLTLTSGANFTGDPSSRNKIIVNEEFARTFGAADPAAILGQTFLINEGRVEVIGIVKNFHYRELTEPIGNFIFQYSENEFQFANVKVASHDIINSLKEMDRVWRPLGGEKKFEAKFFDVEMEDAYKYYFTFIKICGFLGFLAITISCLGLLGMVVLTAEYRTKEVGIRKVMGATTSGLVTMLSMDFIKLIAIASCIALPLTYLFFDKIYLRSQYYKLPIGAIEILISLAIITVLGLTTILSQTIKTAKTNPVDTLRTE
ncbi:MAG: ABC transporter permease [Cyclobacteriaceae bacterium]